MPSIKETIASLDALREKVGNKDITINHDWMPNECALFVKCLVENYPTLRQAALDGERYRKEAEAAKLLAKVVEETLEYDPEYVTLKIEEAFKTYRQAVE